jgi:hypothetical protein
MRAALHRHYKKAPTADSKNKSGRRRYSPCAPRASLFSAHTGEFMIGDEDKTWRNLRERPQTEQDPKKLIELIKEINRLLQERQVRLRTARLNDAAK